MEVETDEILPGEVRHQRKLIDLQRKREAFRARTFEDQSPSSPSSSSNAPSAMILGPNGLPVLDIAELKRVAAANAIRERQTAFGQHTNKGNRASSSSSSSPSTIIKEIVIPSSGMTVRELASRLSMKLAEVTGKLEDLGEVEGPELY
jgi:hypothetical protein